MGMLREPTGRKRTRPLGRVRARNNELLKLGRKDWHRMGYGGNSSIYAQAPLAHLP